MNLHRINLGVVHPMLSQHFPGIHMQGGLNGIGIADIGLGDIGDVASDCAAAGMTVNSYGTACADPIADQNIAANIRAILTAIPQPGAAPLPANFAPSTDPNIYTTPSYIKNLNQQSYAQLANQGLIPGFTQAQFDAAWDAYMGGSNFNPDAFNAALNVHNLIVPTAIRTSPAVINQPAPTTPTVVVNPTPSPANPTPVPTVPTPGTVPGSFVSPTSVRPTGSPITLAQLNQLITVNLNNGLSVSTILSKLQSAAAQDPNPANAVVWNAAIQQLQASQSSSTGSSSSSGGTGAGNSLITELSSIPFASIPIPLWGWLAAGVGAFFVLGGKKGRR